MRNILMRGRIFALALLTLILSVTTTFAQSTRGAVTGTVTDQSGAVIVAAKVDLTSPATNVTVTTVTNKAGVYRFDGVLVGDYNVSVEAQGFAKTLAPLTVNVGALVGRDFQLAAGSSTSVEVTVNPPDIQTEDSVRSQVIPAEQLAELPIAGQNSLNLILTAPGVVPSKTGSNSDGGIGAVNGARSRSNNFLLDGINNNDISVTGPQFIFYNNDALAQVSYQTSNFTPEFGRAGGAVVSQITKSGTNQIHGTVAWVYRTSLFNASTQTQRNNWRSGGMTSNLVPKYVEHIPAFTVGGPVRLPFYDGRDKTFFFGAGQWDRYSSGGTQSTFTIPTASGYSVLNSLASACPNVARYLGLLGSLRGASGAVGSSNIPINVQANLANTTCNGTARTGQQVEVGPYVRTVPELSKDNNHLVRIDHVVSPKQQLMFRWLYDKNSDNVGGVIGMTPDYDVPFKAQYMAGNFNDTYTFSPRVVNEFRFGFSRNNYGWFLSGGGIGTTLEAITIAGGPSVPNISSTFPQGRVSNTWQYNDTVTLLKGRHAFKFGAEILRQLAVQDAPYNYRGTVGYAASTQNTFVTTAISGLANYIDNYAGPSGTVGKSFGTGHYRPNLFSMAFFFQDIFKVNSDLTLTYGVRYENFGQPGNIFRYPVVTTGLDLDNTQRVNQDNNNFGPAFGFSYSPSFVSSRHSFVLRGGYNITYDTWFNNMLSNMTAGVPNTQSSQPIVTTSNATTPRGLNGVSGILPTLAAVPLNPYLNFTSQYKKNMANPYYHHFAFGIQQDIASKFVVDLAYVGSLGRQLFFTNNVNPTQPNATFSGADQISTAYGTQSRRLYSTRGLIQPRESGMTSSYHSLQLQLRRRQMNTFAGKVSFNSSYTWSKAMDNGSDVFATYATGSLGSKSISQWGPAANFDHGPMDTDRRHTSSTVIAMDFRGVSNHLLNEFVGGWSVAPILNVLSGAPFTIFNGTDRDLDGTASNDRPNIGNPNAPVNTRAVIVGTATCASGYYDPNRRTTSAIPISAACVNPTDVRWVQAPTYQPTSPVMASRNSMYTTRYLGLDMNVLKKFTISDHLKAELRGEFFNITNNQNFDTPNQPATVSSTANTFMDFTTISGGARNFRIGAKILF
ncbi:TonB-dependent receptor [Terriglobus tenax]|uniref:TonB-dependent receptor n=1 Tax=Terriglobus tenax TaxID=1111115 RepID=UPI0021DF7695|nr:TonB-dependent receptor [Terriglobus tenax]